MSKQLLVRFDGNDYSVPTEHAHRPCVARGFVDRVEIEVNHEQAAVHPRRYGQGQFVLEPLHYLKLLEHKPGSLDNARPFKQTQWGEELSSMRKELEYRQPGGAGTKQFIEILQLALAHPMEALRGAVGACVNRRAYSAAAVVNVLRNEPARPAPRLDLSARDELCGVIDGIRSLAIYDRLSMDEPCPGATATEAACPEFIEAACPELACPELVERAEAACPELVEEVLS